jgi:hypothetical protein
MHQNIEKEERYYYKGVKSMEKSVYIAAYTGI